MSIRYNAIRAATFLTFLVGVALLAAR